MSTMKNSAVVDDRIGYVLKQTQDALRRRMDAVLAIRGLTTPMYAVLSVLLRNSEISNAGLARACFVTPQSMNELVLNLERSGLIRRRPDVRNARVLRAELTAKGKKLLSSCDQDLEGIESQMLAPFSKAERQQLHDMLSACRDALLLPGA